MAITRIFTRKLKAKPAERRRLSWERPGNRIAIVDDAGRVLHQCRGSNAEDAGVQFDQGFFFLLACGFAEDATASLADATPQELDHLLDHLPGVAESTDLVCTRRLATEPDHFHTHYLRFIHQATACAYGEQDDGELKHLQDLAARLTAVCQDQAAIKRVPKAQQRLIPRAQGLVASFTARTLQAQGRLDQLDRIVALYREAVAKRPDSEDIKARLDAAVAEQAFVKAGPATVWLRAAKLAADVQHPDRSAVLNTVYASAEFAAWLDAHPKDLPARISSQAANEQCWASDKLNATLCERALVNRFRAILAAAKKARTPLNLGDLLKVCAACSNHRGIAFALEHATVDSETMADALAEACGGENLHGRTVRFLLAHGAKADVPDGCGYHPFARLRHHEMSKLRHLLAAGMDVNARSPSGSSALQEEFGDRTLFQLAMPRDEEPTIDDENAFDNAVLLMRALVENGADPQAPAAKGASARDIARTFEEHGKLLAVLDGFGVPAEAKSDPGQGPIDVPALKRLAEAQLKACPKAERARLGRLWEVLLPPIVASKQRITPQQLLQGLAGTMPETWPRLTAALNQLDLPETVAFDRKQRINLHVGDLALKNLSAPGILVVLGDLEVATFDDTEEGSLIVCGSMTAQDMHTEGWVHVQDDLTVAGVLYGQNEDKSLYVGGRTRAQVIIEDGHALICRVVSADAHVTRDDRLHDAKWRKTFVAGAFAADDDRRQALSWNALQRLRSGGKPVLLGAKAPAGTRRPKR